MTQRSFHVMTLGMTALIIAGFFVLDGFVPGIPSWAYALGGVALGAIVLAVAKGMVKKSRLVLSDERTERNFKDAASTTYRVSLFAMMIFVFTIFSIPSLPAEWLIAGRAVLVVMIFQAYLFLALFAIKSRRS